MNGIFRLSLKNLVKILNYFSFISMFQQLEHIKLKKNYTKGNFYKMYRQISRQGELVQTLRVTLVAKPYISANIERKLQNFKFS